MTEPKPDIRDAATVILCREREGEKGLEFYMVRRHRGAGFMASAYVFPGGISDERDAGELKNTAVRELFEEAGVLLTTPPLPQTLSRPWREKVDQEGANLIELVRDAGAELDTRGLLLFAHWITPSVEKRRYSAKFYVARMPPGQTASPCDRETVDETWVSASEALERKGELKLPPPQIRIFVELEQAANAGWDSVESMCRARASDIEPILPRAAPVDGGFALLLPWDPDYESLGQGESRPMRADHPHAVGPSRFLLSARGWDHVGAPRSGGSAE